jgi:3-oxoacyl-[acyl-carrier protein] reductase
MISTAFHGTFARDASRTHVADATALEREGRTGKVADSAAYLASLESSSPRVNLDINRGIYYSLIMDA